MRTHPTNLVNPARVATMATSDGDKYLQRRQGIRTGFLHAYIATRAGQAAAVGYTQMDALLQYEYGGRNTFAALASKRFSGGVRAFESLEHAV